MDVYCVHYIFKICQIVAGMVKVQRADLTCDVIKKLAPFVLSKLWILITDWSMRWSCDTFLIKLRLYKSVNFTSFFNLIFLRFFDVWPNCATAAPRRMPEATLMAQLSSFAARTHVGFAWKFVWLSRFQRDNVRAIIELVYTLDTANHMACRKVKPSLHYRVVVLVLGRCLCEVAHQTFYWINT